MVPRHRDYRIGVVETQQRTYSNTVSIKSKQVKVFLFFMKDAKTGCKKPTVIDAARMVSRAKAMELIANRTDGKASIVIFFIYPGV